MKWRWIAAKKNVPRGRGVKIFQFKISKKNRLRIKNDCKFLSSFANTKDMTLILSWLILSTAFWIAAILLPGVHLKGAWNALVAAALFGVLNFFLGWIFYVIFAIGTLGIALLLLFITRLVVTAIILKITSALTHRLHIEHFGWALLMALIIALVGVGAEWVLELTHPDPKPYSRPS
jgi:putative membrane protein